MTSQKIVDEKIMVNVEENRIPKQTNFDPRDLSLQLGRKGKGAWVGSKCHVVETAERGAINFVTDMIYQSANRHDAAVHEQITENIERLGLSPRKLYTDSNYVSGDHIRYYRERSPYWYDFVGIDAVLRENGRTDLSQFRFFVSLSA